MADKDILRFRAITRVLIRKNFPRAYHNKHEWEYEGHATNTTIPLVLSVWKTTSRKDIPYQYTLTNEEKEAVVSLFPF